MNHLFELQGNPKNGNIEIIEMDKEGFVFSSTDVTDWAIKLVLDRLFRECNINPDGGLLEICGESLLPDR
jgi:hypothetical protein